MRWIVQLECDVISESNARVNFSINVFNLDSPDLLEHSTMSIKFNIQRIDSVLHLLPEITWSWLRVKIMNLGQIRGVTMVLIVPSQSTIFLFQDPCSTRLCSFAELSKQCIGCSLSTLTTLTWLRKCIKPKREINLAWSDGGDIFFSRATPNPYVGYHS